MPTLKVAMDFGKFQPLDRIAQGRFTKLCAFEVYMAYDLVPKQVSGSISDSTPACHGNATAGERGSTPRQRDFFLRLNSTAQGNRRRSSYHTTSTMFIYFQQLILAIVN